MIRSLAAMLIAFSAAASAADKTLTEKRGEVDTAIAEMVRLLEAKDYTTLIETFAAPKTLAGLTEGRKIEDVAKTFGEEKAERLLKTLKLLKDVKPTMSDKDTKATYELKEEVNFKKSITFQKIEKFWYIADK